MSKKLIKSITTYSVLGVILAGICYFTLDTSMIVEVESTESSVEEALEESTSEVEISEDVNLQ